MKVSTPAEPRLLLILGLCILLGIASYSAYQLYSFSREQHQIKTDYSNINNITFGLFSVTQWRDEVSGIVRRQVQHLELTPQQKKQLRREVEEVMYTLIDKAESLLNKKKKTIGGKIKKFVIKTFVNTDNIRSKVPGFTERILRKIDGPSGKRKLSNLAMSKFDDLRQSDYIDSTAAANQAETRKVFNRYHAGSVAQLNQLLAKRLSVIKSAMYMYSFVMIGAVIAVLLLWWILRKNTELHTTLFIMSLLLAFILLAVGLTASMIEVDARIKSFDFVLLGEHVVFENQVLFFQSKSILDVVRVLLKQPAADSVAVGALIFLFSVLFPVMKLASTGIHLLGRKSVAENRFIQFFAFQSGKWSMADVIVIAILMVYIGLNGLLERQLAGLNIKSDLLTVITTHNTALQPGYIIFICFVLFGLILSTILKYITPHDAH